MEVVKGSSLSAIARRLIVLIDLLARGDSHLSSILGYANATTIHKLRRGKTLLGARRLSMLAELEVEPGLYPSLHWALTGLGPTVIDPESTNASRANALTLESNAAAAEVTFTCRLETDPESQEILHAFKARGLL
jgi:hypothetical protein